MPETVSWYSFDRKLKTVEHGSVSLSEALSIAERYHGNAGNKYQMGEDAIADTMFGFVRQGDRAFIELCVNGSSQISCRLEVPRPATSWLRRILGRPPQIERDLDSWGAMAARIEDSSPCRLKRSSRVSGRGPEVLAPERTQE